MGQRFEVPEPGWPFKKLSFNRVEFHLLKKTIRCIHAMGQGSSDPNRADFKTTYDGQLTNGILGQLIQGILVFFFLTRQIF